jgi:hypothetical protein
MDTIYEDEENSNNANTNEDVDIPAEESSIHIDCMNICQVYFKTLFKKNNEHMLTGINPKDEYSTSRSMEFMYETMFKYNTNLANNSKLCDIYVPSQLNKYLLQMDYEELYGLLIDGTIEKVSPSLFAIITYIAHEIKWKTAQWTIVPLKTDTATS